LMIAIDVTPRASARSATVRTLGSAIIKELMGRRIMATINQEIDYTTASAVAEALGIPTE